MQLDLRAEADGLVRPDPASMIAPEVGVPVESQPQRTATRSPALSAAPMPTPALLRPEARIEAPSGDSFSWPGLFLLIFLAGAATLVILLARRGRAV